MNDWAPVIMAVHKITGEAKVIFRERDVWSQHPDIFPGYAPTMAVENYLRLPDGLRVPGEAVLRRYGQPHSYLGGKWIRSPIEAKIVYYNINQTRGVAKRARPAGL